MSSIADVLKAEIKRIALREIRSELQTFRKTAVRQRHEIAALKRQIRELEHAQRRQARGEPAGQREALEDASAARRFSSKGLRSHRARLGLTAVELGRLLGVSAQTVHNWEGGKSVPRANQMPAIAALRKTGKREAKRLTGETQQG
ncbi:MAG: helix-turn-helix domain-containing protein [Betaproteobacteria bacterium]|jgi:DNA-binding transcriptional regulator YiaG